MNFQSIVVSSTRLLAKLSSTSIRDSSNNTTLKLVNELSKYCPEFHTFACQTKLDLNSQFIKKHASYFFQNCKAIDTIQINNSSSLLSCQFERYEFEAES